MTAGLHEFGMAFTTLGQAEAGALGEGLTQTGAAADKLSSLANAKAEKEALVFEEPIHEYIRCAQICVDCRPVTKCPPCSV